MQKNQTPSPQGTSCTAFDHTHRLATGTYRSVAIAVKEHLRTAADASVLIFDDSSGRQIDFDLRGTDEEIAARIGKQFPADTAATTRAVGRPKLGVVSREVTLLPQQWEWLAEQSGGASATLRRLVEEARRAAPTPQARLRKIHERTYNFMSAMAGNLPNFEEASRALFSNDRAAFKKLLDGWPADVVAYLDRLSTDAVIQDVV